MKKLMFVLIAVVLLAACAPSVKPQTGPTPSASPLPAPTTNADGGWPVEAWNVGRFETDKGLMMMLVTLKEGDSFDIQLEYGDMNLAFQDRIPDLTGVAAYRRLNDKCPVSITTAHPYVGFAWRQIKLENVVVCVGEEYPRPYTLRDNSTGESSTIVPPDENRGYSA